MRRFRYVWMLAAMMFLSMTSFAYANGVPTVNLPKTGQKACYNAAGLEIACANTGQDGEKRAGVAWPIQRFTVGTGAEADCVTDNLTGLMWAKDGNLPNETKMWQQALDYVASINSGDGLCGYNDWRLPNVNELKSLVHWGEADPVAWLISQGFTNVQSGDYWSSSTRASNTGFAWSVHMWLGYVSNDNKGNDYYVWPVRAGQ